MQSLRRKQSRSIEVLKVATISTSSLKHIYLLSNFKIFVSLKVLTRQRHTATQRHFF